MSDAKATIIYTVSATLATVASFPNTDAVRIGKNRYVPSLKVLLNDQGRSEVMAIPVVIMELNSKEDVEAMRKALYNKVDAVLNQILDGIQGDAGESSSTVGS